MTPTALAALRAWYAKRNPARHTCPTRTEHDARVDATGRPFTQPQWDTLRERPGGMRGEGVEG